MAIQTKNFQKLFYVVWAGAFNDNFFKILLLTLISQQYSGGKESFLVSLTGAILVLPYIILAPLAGWLADRFAKSFVTLFTRILEPFLIILGSYFLFSNNIIGLLIVLCGFGTQSTLFSPAKYGMIAEITPPEKLTRANGWIELSTFLGILLGTAVGSQVLLISNHSSTLSIAILGTVSLGAIYSAMKMKPTPVQNPNLQLNWHLVRVIKENLIEIKSDKTLFKVTIAACWFWLIGAFSQLAIFVFSSEIPDLDETGVGYVIIAIIVGIGLGSVLVGLFPQRYLKQIFISSSLALSLSALLTGTVATDLTSSVIIFLFMGISAGFYIVPLNAIFQDLSPEEKRGNYWAAFNVLSNIAILLASMFLWLFNSLCGIPLKTIFIVIAIITLLITKFCSFNDQKLPG